MGRRRRFGDERRLDRQRWWRTQRETAASRDAAPSLTQLRDRPPSPVDRRASYATSTLRDTLTHTMRSVRADDHDRADDDVRYGREDDRNDHWPVRAVGQRLLQDLQREQRQVGSNGDANDVSRRRRAASC